MKPFKSKMSAPTAKEVFERIKSNIEDLNQQLIDTEAYRVANQSAVAQILIDYADYSGDIPIEIQKQIRDLSVQINIQSGANSKKLFRKLELQTIKEKQGSQSDKDEVQAEIDKL